MRTHDIRVAAYGVIVHDARILLAHVNDAFTRAWTLPGGGLNPFETPSDAAVREILEETGHAAALDGLLGVDSDHVPAAHRPAGTDLPLHALRIVYRARIVGGELRNEREGTTDEARWFPLEEVAGLARVRLVDAGLEMWRRFDPVRPKG